LPVLLKKDKLPEIVFMEKRYFSLEIREDNQLTKIFRIIFGLICCAIAVFWLTFKFTSIQADSTQWITIAFLFSFGAYQIIAGFGYAARYIELNSGKIKLKQNSFLPAIELLSGQVSRIELFPLKVLFFNQNGKKVLLRFGISDPDKVELIKAEIIRFADSNKISLEIMSE
jgi:hypothetical protein